MHNINTPCSQLPMSICCNGCMVNNNNTPAFFRSAEINLFAVNSPEWNGRFVSFFFKVVQGYILWNIQCWWKKRFKNYKLQKVIVVRCREWWKWTKWKWSGFKCCGAGWSLQFLWNTFTILQNFHCLGIFCLPFLLPYVQDVSKSELLYINDKKKYIFWFEAN